MEVQWTIFEKVLVTVPKFSGFLSVLGSTSIILEVLSDHRAAKGDVIKRILLGMSATDLCMALSWVMTSWPSPASANAAPFAIGTVQTCTLQGVFLQFGNCATPIYNGALALCFMLKVRYSWNESALKGIEKWIHGFILSLAAGTALVSVPLELYNTNVLVCWIASHPPDCHQSFTLGPGEETDCIRGDNSTIYAFAFLNIWIWLSYALILFSMTSMYLFVSRTERRTLLYRRPSRRSISLGVDADRSRQRRSSIYSMFRSGDNQQNLGLESLTKKTKKIATQARWYILAYLLTQIPDTICTSLAAAYGRVNYWLWLFTYILNPCQGFANFLVFSRKRSMATGFGRTLKHIAFLESIRNMCVSCRLKFCNPNKHCSLGNATVLVGLENPVNDVRAQSKKMTIAAAAAAATAKCMDISSEAE